MISLSKRYWATFLLALAFAYRPALAQDATYPIVIKDNGLLLKSGIGFLLHGNENEHGNKHYKNKCYDYGGGGYDFSVSDEFLARYVAKGFTLESLCLGLVSEARFDPETGKRLPTFVFFNLEGLRNELNVIQDDQLRPEQRKYKRRDPESMTQEELLDYGIGEYLTEELPLALPPCFKNGTPYSDCAWRYAIKTGERLSNQSVEKFGKLGRAIETAMRRAMTEKPACAAGAGPPTRQWPCHAMTHRTADGFLQPASNTNSIVNFINTMSDIFPGQPEIPEALLKGNNAEFFDVSPNFPRGFGYTLYAQSGLGPGGNNSWLSERAGGAKLKSQVTEATLLKHVAK
jgi:hypothetical protein